MAWYDGVYKCGHKGQVNIVGPSKERQSKADWHFSGLCPDCYKRQLQYEKECKDRDAAEKSKEMNLPELSGTEKQVAWANSLRINVIDSLYSGCKKIDDKLNDKGLDTIPDENVGMKEIVDAVEYFIQKHTDAKFWIETRDTVIRIKDVVREYKSYMETMVYQDVISEMKDEDENLTVSPVCESGQKGVVKIIFREGILRAEYIKSNEFIEIVKKLGYEWNGSVWGKSINEYSGSLNDRAAELGHKLLLNGFTVQFPNTESRSMAASGEFTEESDRWIKYNEKEEKLAIRWKKRSDTLYKSAKMLPGARWKDGAMIVEIEYYREVMDFEETMNFMISKKAQEKIEAYKKKESGFEVENVSQKKKDVVPDEERIAKALKSGGIIIKDLIDE